MENQDQSQEQKTTQENKLLSPILNSNINKAGLPKHGTQWARAQNPKPRELNLEERNAPL